MRKGFTLLELLIVIAIVGILSATILVALNGARDKANDARRKSDLAQAVRALNLYYDKHDNYMDASSGCGSSGNGWFNYENGGSYPTAMSKCLVNDGITPQELIDPTGDRTSTPANQGHAYMKYSCSYGTYVFASLDGLPRFTDGPTNGTCCASCDTSYGMNYYVQIAP